MSRIVLLARPHPFIAANMVPFLESHQFEAHKSGPHEYDHASAPRPVGAVISLAVASDVTATAEEVATALRQRWSDLPLVFAALLSVERATMSLDRLAASLLPAGHTVITPDSTDADSAVLGNSDTLLYLNHNHLEDGQGRLKAGRMLQKHFG